jgi:hypothetical protein
MGASKSGKSPSSMSAIFAIRCKIIDFWGFGRNSGPSFLKMKSSAPEFLYF